MFWAVRSGKTSGTSVTCALVKRSEADRWDARGRPKRSVSPVFRVTHAIMRLLLLPFQNVGAFTTTTLDSLVINIFFQPEKKFQIRILIDSD